MLVKGSDSIVYEYDYENDYEIGCYMNWLYSMIRLNDYVEQYWMLLLYLSGRQFTWSIHHDRNRAKDGYSLRTEFADTYGFDEQFWVGKMPEDCSILEMMVALSDRIEDAIHDPQEGDRTPMWFWMMIKSLGLEDMTNHYFSKDFCKNVCDRFLARRYSSNGEGGLFITLNPELDMRRAEIWYQMQVWISENF